MKIIGYVAIVGNILFLLFFLHNAIDEGGGGTPVELVAKISLIVLLILNTFVLVRNK